LKKQGKPASGRWFDPVTSLEDTTPLIRGLVVAIALIVVLCLLMPEILFQNRIFLSPDSKAWFSFASVGRETLEKGTYPLWNPYIFCGMPSYPTQAYTPFVYPVSFITHVLHAYLHFPEMTWLLVHYLLAGAGAFLLLRSLGAGAAVSLLCGAMFMIMPNYIAIGAHGHGSQACSTAYMPFALLFALNIMRGRKRIVMASLLAIALGFQMLRGHIQISYYTYLLIGFLFIYQSVALLRRREYSAVAANTAFFAAAFIVALGIASVLVIPVREYSALSIRGGEGGGLDYGYATGWSLHPKEVLTFVFPWAFGFGKGTYTGAMPFTDYPNYLGITTVLFSILALVLAKSRWKWFLLSAALLATVIGFGKFLPVLYGPMFKLLPYFNKFRVPVMVLIVQQLALVALMGLGLDAFLRLEAEGGLAKRLNPGYLKWVLVGCAVVLLLVLVLGESVGGAFSRSLESHYASAGRSVGRETADTGARAFSFDLIRTIAILTAIIAVLYLAASRKLRPGLAFIIIAVVSLVDMFSVDAAVLHPERVWKAEEFRIINETEERDRFMEPDALSRFLQTDESIFRIFPAPDPRTIGRWSHNYFPFNDNRFMIWRIYSMGGYHAAKLRNYQNVMDVMFESFNQGRFPIQMLNMFNAKYIVSLLPLFREGTGMPVAWKQGNSVIYENTGVLPRAWLVDSVQVMPHERALRELASPGFDPSSVVLLEKEPAVRPVSTDGSGVEITDYQLNSITLKAHIEQPCVLVLSEIAYPDWKAIINGKETEILTADYCLRALPLGPGDHDIVFVYRSGVLRMSLIISIVMFGAAVAVPLIGGLIARREV